MGRWREFTIPLGCIRRALKMDIKKEHPKLYDLLRRAYSAEKAASFAYIGHAGSLKNPEEKARVKEIEDDELESGTVPLDHSELFSLLHSIAP